MLKDALGALVSVVFSHPRRICGPALANASRVPVCGKCLDALLCIEAVLLLKYDELTGLGDRPPEMVEREARRG
jgi:hypothetical protein